ncbi:SigB/SigF/SigG family RNA polymerase sigma factor [Terrabacter aeriphilus]|uniref:SigB/SigF/SigG family RNA polymerase sigma factor n=1 Tax=Terrabacter aeriphilus TaxID=515662 RepID=A0ABP9JKL6_9MICO
MRDDLTRELFERRGEISTQLVQSIDEQIVELYLPLSDGMARRYVNKGIEEEDLVQVARLALVKAISRFDVGNGCSFAAFAVPTIAGELKRHFRDHGWMVRPSRRVQELRISARIRRRELEQELGHTPSRTELAEELGVPAEMLAEADANDSSFRPLSIDAPTAGGDETTLGATIAVTDPELEQVCDHVALSAALRDLDDRTRRVLLLRFVDEATQREIADEVGASQMQVSRMLKRALAGLRESMDDDHHDASGVATDAAARRAV